MKDAFISKDLGKIKFSVPEFIKNDQELNSFIISINEAEKKMVEMELFLLIEIVIR